MEGPSIVIACEELSPFFNRKISYAQGTVNIPIEQLAGNALRSAKSWGKHLILVFDDFTVRVHFLMFGSYRINNPRENRVPKLRLCYQSAKGDDEIAFYSCAIKIIDDDLESVYDWSTDVMSAKWKSAKAHTFLKKHPRQMVCDLLMNQEVFTGVGNIIKNEVLFNRRLHPQTFVGTLSETSQRALIKEARSYSKNFYKWKKLGELKRHWLIFRKPSCPICGRKTIKKPTGVGKRMSFFCRLCQPKPPTKQRLKTAL